MAANVFAFRPIDAKIVQYCANDVIYLPDLHALYLKRIQGNWFARVKQESERRVAEAHSPWCEPQSPAKKLGPWGSETERRVMTLDEMLDELEQRREDDLARDIFGNDDEVGYYDYDNYDDNKVNSLNAVGAEAFDSCWDKNS